MNRKEFKLLCESWSSFINEISVDISGRNRTRKMIDDISNGNYSFPESEKMLVVIDDKVSHEEIIVKLCKKKDASLNKTANSVKFKKITQGENFTFEDNAGVRREIYSIAMSNVEGNFGPLLYEIGIEYISNILDKKGSVASDRFTVTIDAYNVWKKFYERADSETNVEKTLLDIHDFTYYHEDYYLHDEFPANSIKKLNNDPRDDVYQVSAFEFLSDDPFGEDLDWSKSKNPLTYAYYKIDTELYDYAIQKDLEVVIL